MPRDERKDGKRKKGKHSGLPWKLEEISGSYFIVGRGPLGEDYTVAEFYKSRLGEMELANAKLIVKAVNSFGIEKA